MKEIFSGLKPILSVHPVVSDWLSHSNWCLWLETEAWVSTANPTCLETWWGWAAAKKNASLISKEDINALSRIRDLFITNIWEYVKVVDDFEVDCSSYQVQEYNIFTTCSWHQVILVWIRIYSTQLWIDISLSIEDQKPKYEARTNQTWNIFCYISGTFLNEVSFST